MGVATRSWYERELGWATAGTRPLQLRTGLRFDVLDVPAGAGLAVLERVARTGPVARARDRVLLLVAAGSAEELPGLLDWLEWGGIELDLEACGAGGRIPAPRPEGQWPGEQRPESKPPEKRREAADDRHRPVWLRPPQPGREVEPTLPALTLTSARSGGRSGTHEPVGLVPLLGALATECHRTRLFPACALPAPCAHSASSRPARSPTRLSNQPCAFS